MTTETTTIDRFAARTSYCAATMRRAAMLLLAVMTAAQTSWAQTQSFPTASGGDGTEGFVGTLKSFRYYDRVLTEEEIVRNRNADAARYFGALGVTNVVVAVEDGANITAAEATGVAYHVEGSHTFSASGPAGLGYRIYVPDASGGWTVSQSFAEGVGYTYVSGTSPDTILLKWGVLQPFVLTIR